MSLLSEPDPMVRLLRHAIAERAVEIAKVRDHNLAQLIINKLADAIG